MVSTPLRGMKGNAMGLPSCSVSGEPVRLVAFRLVSYHPPHALFGGPGAGVSREGMPGAPPRGKFLYAWD
jgi:hypothetical protein